MAARARGSRSEIGGRIASGLAGVASSTRSVGSSGWRRDLRRACLPLEHCDQAVLDEVESRRWLTLHDDRVHRWEDDRHQFGHQRDDDLPRQQRPQRALLQDVAVQLHRELWRAQAASIVMEGMEARCERAGEPYMKSRWAGGAACACMEVGGRRGDGAGSACVCMEVGSSLNSTIWESETEEVI